MTRKGLAMAASVAAGAVATVALTWLLSGQAALVDAAPPCGPSGGASSVITVCLGGSCDYTSIQAAVDNASNGDLVKVAAGTYTGVSARPRRDVIASGTVSQVVYLSKTITIRGGYTTTNAFADPPAPLTYVTTLDAQRQGRVIYITGDVSPTVEGLHITAGDATGLSGGHGPADAGGGVYIYTATATVRGNWVFDNTAGGSASSQGGGVFLYGSTGTISDNAVFSNSAATGGGIALHASAATVSGNSVYSNTATSSSFGGGGLLVRDSDQAVLSSNVVYSNTAGSGGGLLLYSSDDVTLVLNAVSSNTVITGGGGLWVEDCHDVTFSGNDFFSNTANIGGGLYLQGSNDATFRGNDFRLNVANNAGGLYVNQSHYAAVERNAFLSNTATSGNGGGMYARQSHTATIRANSWFSNSASSSGGGLYLYQSNKTDLDRNEFTSNSAYDGGGLYAYDGDTCALSANTFLTNTVGNVGGGLVLNDTDATLVNDVVVDNAASSTGAGLYVQASSPQLSHTTFAGNHGGNGRGTYVTHFGASYSHVTLVNAIIVSHTTGVYVTGGSTATLSGVLWSGNGGNLGGTGAITVTSAVTGTPRFAPDGYHIVVGSAAVDAGVPADVQTDIDGQSRLYGVADLGADELTIHVTVGPTVGATIVYTDPQGLTTTVEIPAGAVAQTTTLVYVPLLSPTHPLSPSLGFANHALELDGYCIPHVYLPLVLRGYRSGTATAVSHGLSLRSPFAQAPVPSPSYSAVSGARVASFSVPLAPCSVGFQTPVTFTIHYSTNDVQGLDEASLGLYYWDGTYWDDVANTCTPASSYVTDTVNHVLEVAICHLSQMGMLGRD